MKVVIVGGVAGGATAAARLRRLSENTEIIILERSGFVSYANCGLPYYIGDVITDKDDLTLQTPDSFKQRFNIDVRTRNEVVEIDRRGKSLKIKNLGDGTTYEETYDKLILTPGAKPTWIDVKNLNKEKTFSLRTVENTFEIKNFVTKNKSRKALILGGGFVALEMAENLKELGLNVTVSIRGKQVMPPLDLDMAVQMHSYMRMKGIELKTEQTPEDFAYEAEKADIVIMATGVSPEAHLAFDAGLKMGTKNSISVDGNMRTSDENIYAAGDAVEVKNYVTEERTLISLAGPANRQGRIIADNICGIESEYKGSQGSAVIKFFDMTAAVTGVNEKTAIATGIDYGKVVTISSSHATYYPGAESMVVKTLFEKKTGRILGAQIVGFDGVDKRIDVMATAIYSKLKGEDLKNLDLAYAPPYGSAKDPVNMAGFVIENVMNGVVKQFFPENISELQKSEDVILLDVRTTSEFDEGHFEGALNIPLDSLRQRIEEIPKGKPLYVNCYSGLRSYVACRILESKGFECYNLSGGYGFYECILEEKIFDLAKRYPCGVEKDDIRINL